MHAAVLSLSHDSTLTRVDVLDTMSGAWSTASPLPTTRSGYQCAVVGTLLYVAGGSESYCNPT